MKLCPSTVSPLYLDLGASHQNTSQAGWWTFLVSFTLVGIHRSYRCIQSTLDSSIIMANMEPALTAIKAFITTGLSHDRSSSKLWHPPCITHLMSIFKLWRRPGLTRRCAYNHGNSSSRNSEASGKNSFSMYVSSLRRLLDDTHQFRFLRPRYY